MSHGFELLLENVPQSTVNQQSQSEIIQSTLPLSSLSPLVLPKAAQECPCHLSVTFISLLLPQPFLHPKSHGINSCWSNYSLNMYKGQCILRRSSLVKHLTDSCLLHFSQVNTAHILLEETLFEMKYFILYSNIHTVFGSNPSPISSPSTPALCVLLLFPSNFMQFSFPSNL